MPRLTLRSIRTISNREVSMFFPKNDAWRLAAPSGHPVLNEPDVFAPPREHVLQQIWLHQRLRRDALRTLDGRRLVVLHPGFWNREAGPDFRRAMLQFDDQSPVVADVEIDLEPADWQHHAHQSNPAYARVRLHVVWQAPGPGSPDLPTLRLSDWLDAPLGELAAWLASDARATSPEGLLGACALPLAEMSAAARVDLLHQAALARLQTKALQIRARARQAGWEQALWEAVFAALGYKHNAWPMRRLAELRSRVLKTDSADPIPVPVVQARLLGLSGLLPADLRARSRAAGPYLRTLWDVWWRDRGWLDDAVLPASLWRLHGTRPANHPVRRLALAAHWLADLKWIDRIEGWFLDELADDRLDRALRTALLVDDDPFWCRHWTFRSRPLGHPQPLLGTARSADLAMNAVLPWLLSRADAGPSTSLRERAQHRYLAWPGAQDNAVLRLARQRFLGDALLPRPARAALQQGLLQIVHDFCDRSDPRCTQCPFPALVRKASDR